MITINNLDEMVPYHIKGTNTYSFKDSVKFTFDLELEANINAVEIKAHNIEAWNVTAGKIDAFNIDAYNIKVI